ALGLLIVLQFLITWSSVRVRWVRRLVTGDPMLVFYKGEMLPAALRRARVTEDEVRAAVRAANVASMDEVEAVALETDGSFSVVPSGSGDASSLEGVDVVAEGESR